MTYKTPKAHCRTCGRPITLNSNGRIRKHVARDDEGNALPDKGHCDGAGKLPKGRNYYQTLTQMREKP